MKFKLSKGSAVAAIVIIVVVALVLSSFIYLSYSATPLGKLQTVTIGALPITGSLIVHVADTQGFFTKNGLAVTIREYDTGLVAMNDLLNGKIDISDSAEYALVGKAFQQQQVKTIAVIDKSSLEYVVGRRDHGIENISDLNGKTIALPKGTIAEFYLARFLTLNNMTSSEVNIVNMTVTQSGDALLNGTVDAIVDWQPYTETVLNSLGSNSVSWSVQSSQQTFGVLSCRSDWIAANPEVVSRFLKALLQAEKFVYTNPSEAKSMIKEQGNVSDTYLETLWSQNQFELSIDQSLVSAMENEARWMMSNNLTNQTVVPNFLDYIYLNGLMSVKPDSVNIIH